MKYVIFPVLALAAISVIFYLVDSSSNTATSPSFLPVQKDSPGRQIERAESILDDYAGSEHDASSSDSFDHVSVSRWRESHGYEIDGSAYNYYDMETINELAKNGDIFAMQRAASVELLIHKNPAKGHELLLQAAASGSTFALIQLGSFYRDAQYPGFEGDGVLESLSWYVVAGQRGDVRQANEQIRMATGQGGLLSRMVGVSRERRELSESEVASVCARAKQFYQQVLNVRLAKGTPQFDNSQMPGTQHHELMLCAL